MGGLSTIDGYHPFSDVPVTAYFNDAVAWMAEEGITLGVTENFYGAADSLTRGQAVSLVARASG
ncbi:MAG TPA: S-layer homology domain-containing protein [Actinobacteria bacterium]|nr:S-layer homology domain-containing protein [Actinomycetota bacterium]